MNKLAYLFFCFFGFIATPVCAGVAGAVVFVSGEVSFGKVNNKLVTVGTTINEGDSLVTGADGHLHVKLADNGLLIIRPNSSAVISDYVFFPEDLTKSRMRIFVSHGVVRSITGSWAKTAPKQFRLNTPIAAIGVRGTDFTIATNSEITRASVSFGGIVMTPLGTGCSMQSLGPCDGMLSAELFSGSLQLLLQSKAGSGKPELLDGKKSGIHPDADAKPGASEPPSGLPYKGGSLLPLPSDLASVFSIALTPVAPQIKWGRWEQLRDPISADEIRVNRTKVSSNAKFALFRDNSPSFIMPREGTASFRLANQDAFFFNSKSNVSTPATVENAKLLVDFGAQTFLTNFSVKGENFSTNINSGGGLFPDGRFISSAVLSNAAITGALSGTSASQAGLLFHRPINASVTAYGATYWVR